MAIRAQAERRTLAAARLGWIDAVMADLHGADTRRKRRATEDLFRSGLTAFAIPIIQSWLQAIIDTGEVPAAREAA